MTAVLGFGTERYGVLAADTLAFWESQGRPFDPGTAVSYPTGLRIVVRDQHVKLVPGRHGWITGGGCMEVSELAFRRLNDVDLRDLPAVQAALSGLPDEYTEDEWPGWRDMVEQTGIYVLRDAAGRFAVQHFRADGTDFTGAGNLVFHGPPDVPKEVEDELVGELVGRVTVPKRNADLVDFLREVRRLFSEIAERSEKVAGIEYGLMIRAEDGSVVSGGVHPSTLAAVDAIRTNEWLAGFEGFTAPRT